MWPVTPYTVSNFADAYTVADTATAGAAASTHSGAFAF